MVGRREERSSVEGGGEPIFGYLGYFKKIETIPACLSGCAAAAAD
jgi:hypothetical protein